MVCVHLYVCICCNVVWSVPHNFFRNMRCYWKFVVDSPCICVCLRCERRCGQFISIPVIMLLTIWLLLNANVLRKNSFQPKTYTVHIFVHKYFFFKQQQDPPQISSTKPLSRMVIDVARCYMPFSLGLTGHLN